MIESFFREEYRGLLSFANSVIHNPALAEEALQETFECAMQNFDKFSRSPDRRQWLYATEKNILRHMLRDKERALRLYVSMDASAELLSSAEAAFSNAELPTDDKDFLLLRQVYMDGYRISELAEHLGLKESALKMRLKRSRERLAKRLE